MKSATGLSGSLIHVTYNYLAFVLCYHYVRSNN